MLMAELPDNQIRNPFLLLLYLTPLLSESDRFRKGWRVSCGTMDFKLLFCPLAPLGGNVPGRQETRVQWIRKIGIVTPVCHLAPGSECQIL
jgi:hypothetical protein